MKLVSTGVPQGSIVGLLLFNIFINHIIKASSKFAFMLYADDTTLLSTHLVMMLRKFKVDQI